MHEPEKQVEIQLGHLCNNRCVFCVSGQVSERKQAGQLPFEPVAEQMRRARERGARKFTILGGEPTIQRNFLDVVRYAVELGFEEIVLFTNGVMTHRRAYVEQVLALGGNFVWRFSIQGGNEAAHDAAVRRPGAFKKLVAGMRHLADLGQPLTVNMCVNTVSYESLPDFPALLGPLGVRQLHIDQVRPKDAGERDDAWLRDIMPTFTQMAGPFRAMLAGFPEAFDANVGNFPYCVMPEWAHRIHHDGQFTWTVAVDGKDQLSEPWDKYENKRADKVKPQSCRACVFDASCNGVFDKYAQFYGFDELRPVSLEQLRALPNRRHFFTWLVEPHVRALEAALAGDAPAAGPAGPARPAGWRLAHVLRDSRQRKVVLELGHAGGGAVTVELTPPAADEPPARAPDAATDRFCLHVTGVRAVEAEEAAALVAWAFETLAAAPGAEAARGADGTIAARGADATDAARGVDGTDAARGAEATVTTPFDAARWRARLGAAADPIAAVARAVHQAGSVGGLRFAGARRLDDGRSVALYLRGGDAGATPGAVFLRPGEAGEPFRVHAVNLPADVAARVTDALLRVASAA